MTQIKARLLALAIGLLPAAAAAQTQLPTIPANSVLGRVGTIPGPAAAVPFAQLGPALFSSNLSSIFDISFGATPNTFVVRGTSLWGARAITSADLPNPSTTTLGGIFSLPVTSNSVLSGIGNDGTPTRATTTGTGNVVRATSPTITTPAITTPAITSGATVSGNVAITGSSSTLFTAGRLGITTPAFMIDSSTANSITGLVVTGQASGNGVNLTGIGETNVPLIINGAGNGTINFGTTSTGAFNSFRNIFVNHDTNPTLTLGSVGGSLAHLSTPGTSGMAITTGGGDQVNILSTASATRQITLTGSNGGNPTIATTAGNLAITPAVVLTGGLSTPLAKASGGTANTAESWQYIETLTASASATLTTSAFTSAFDDYALVFGNITPATDGVSLNATVESGGSFQATTYLNATAPTTSIDISTATLISNSAGKGVNGTIFLTNVNSTSVNKFLSGRLLVTTQTSLVPASVNVSGYWNGGQGAVTRARFQMSSGNFTGTIKVYGLRNN